MKKESIKLIIAFILGGLFFGAFSVYATLMIVASNVDYLPRDNEWNVENVEDALDELYDMARNYTGTINFEGIEFEYDYTGTVQQLRVPASGEYKIELWGAQGNHANRGRSIGGLGAYTSGYINLEKGTMLYVYVGENRLNRDASFNAGSVGGGSTDSVNSGSINGYGGGGATDVRLVSGNWDNFDSLKSRIMVAAGGGGGSDYAYPINGGAGGGLKGYDGKNGKYPSAGVPNVPPTGASQIDGGKTSVLSVSGGLGTSGTFGKGGNGNTQWGSAGGGGYYGGAGGGYTSNSVDSGAGGSSFISGHDGCNAIDSSSTSSNIVHTNQPNHYLELTFSQTRMIDGEGYEWTTEKGNKVNQPQPNGTTAVGHTGNGYARITFVG